MKPAVPSLCLVALVACNEVDLQTAEFGALSVDPAAIEVTACDFQEQALTLTSVGEASVRVSTLAVEGTGWLILEAPPTPFTLRVGETADLVVLGREGAATLVVTSDDRERPSLRVPLNGLPNAPPTISVEAPTAGSIVEPGDPLIVSVTDPDGEVEGLVVTWESSVDGPVDVGLVGADGRAEGLWLEGTGGEQTLTAAVTDACDAPATASVDVCRQEGYVSDALDLSTWVFEGSARYDAAEEWVELTNIDGTFQLGSAFQTTETTGSGVHIAFRFFVSGGTGADGFALTALDTSRASTYLAHPGGCLGYGGGGPCAPDLPLYGWSIELDTFFSPGIDPTEADHVSFHFDGDVAGYEAYAALPEMEDGAWHTMDIDVDAPRVTIAVDDIVYIDQDIPGTYDFPAQVGFTAATGGETNYHLIDTLSVVEDACSGGD